MFVYSRTFTITVSGGTGSDAGNFKHEVLKQVICVPPNSSAQYDLAITNPSSVGLYDAPDEQGTLNESTDLLLRDTHTITISNADTSGDYTVTLISYEPHG